MNTKLKALALSNIQKRIVFATVLSIISISFPVIAASKPLFVWKDVGSNKPIGKIWALSNADSKNANVAVDLHQSVGFRCQSLNPCPEPTGYYRISYTFNCPAKLSRVNNNTLSYRGEWQKLRDIPSQSDFDTWEVFAVACPMWSREVEKLRKDGFMYKSGFVKIK